MKIMYILLLLVMSTLQITAWNARSLTCAGPYLQELLELKSDILFLSEHRLYTHELYKLNDFSPNFNVIAKSSNDLDNANQGKKLGHCGTAMFVNRDLAQCVKSVNCDSDRIIAIEIIQVQIKTYWLLVCICHKDTVRLLVLITI